MFLASNFKSHRCAQLALYLFRSLTVFIIRAALKFSKILISSKRNLLTLTFYSSAATDGTGAQIQRLLSVRLLADFLDCNYLHSPITTVSVHPLDPFQTKGDLEKYLGNLNSTFQFENSGLVSENASHVYISSLKPLKLLQIALRILFLNQNLIAHILETYPTSDVYPEMLTTATRFSTSFYKSDYYVNAPLFDVVIHYRQGVGGFAIYPGQNIPRQLPLEFYLKTLEVISQNHLPRPLQVCLLTDAPPMNLNYEIQDFQLQNWVGTPNVTGTSMTIQAMSFEAFQSMEGINLEIIYGGDPIQAISIMSKARHLLISRSSLSYVSALLNHSGKIYYPEGFWHPSLPTWEIRK
jgi:hypothetical protein